MAIWWRGCIVEQHQTDIPWIATPYFVYFGGITWMGPLHEYRHCTISIVDIISIHGQRAKHYQRINEHDHQWINGYYQHCRRSCKLYIEWSSGYRSRFIGESQSARCRLSWFAVFRRSLSKIQFRIWRRKVPRHRVNGKHKEYGMECTRFLVLWTSCFMLCRIDSQFTAQNQ